MIINLIKAALFCLVTKTSKPAVQPKTGNKPVEKRQALEIVKVKVPIFSMQPLGSLMVFALQTPEEANMGAPFHGYYWSDAALPTGFGPFAHIYEAVEHYKHTILQAKGRKIDPKSPLPEVKPIIRVDFRNKKKVETNLP